MPEEKKPKEPKFSFRNLPFQPSGFTKRAAGELPRKGSKLTEAQREAYLARIGRELAEKPEARKARLADEAARREADRLAAKQRLLNTLKGIRVASFKQKK